MVTLNVNQTQIRNENKTFHKVIRERNNETKMSMPEEDRQKNNNCRRSGLGLAAAAIGVSVGAALYYFLSKNIEHPDGEGSCEQPHPFNILNNESDTSMENNCNNSTSSLEDSYTTFSETTTTDTSIHSNPESEDSYTTFSETTTTDTSIHSNPESEDSYTTFSETTTTDTSIHSNPESEDSYTTFSETTTTDTSIHSNPESEDSFIDVIPNLEESFGSTSWNEWREEWDVTESSLEVPAEDRRSVSPTRMLLDCFGTLFSPRPSEQRRRTISEQEHRDILRAQAFRQRSWSLEECSICFEIMLKDQELRSLPCAHKFHSACLAPWLEEQQTCPNCRKSAE